MFDCNAEVIAFHNQKVSLPTAEADHMRERRDANRSRLKKGLERDEKPKAVGCRTQGSYAMRTMVQHIELDYDIDDGVYFDRDDLFGPRGGVISAADAKEMVRAAIHDDKFKTPPEVLKNCIRINYDKGYHVDVPVYRRELIDQSYVYEIASTEWKRSDPLAVTNWFKDQNKAQSPDLLNGGQLRRVVRLLKAFARSRESWSSKIASGFMITKLVVEKFQKDASREDVSLRRTMEQIFNRLQFNLDIDHPILFGEKLTKGAEDGRSKFLREKLEWAIGQLTILDRNDCTEDDARKAWDRVFSTTFFSNQGPSKKVSSAITSAAILRSDGTSSANKEAVDKRGGGRYG